MTIAAEFTNGSKTRKASLSITKIEGGRREYLATFEVEGKREARKLAADHNATPWNF